MAVNEFKPAALEVAQVSEATVGGTLAGETFEISVGGVIIASHTDADTVIATTVAALVVAWNNSTHPYATQVTATDASPDVVLTSDVAGLPFEITLNTPGGISTFVETEPTSNEGPNNWNSDANWSLGLLPSATDNVVIDSDVDICWGLAHQGVVIASLDIRKNRARIGLRSHQFATQANGRVYDTTVPEYRLTYLDIQVATNGLFRVGALSGGPDNKIASDRIKIDLGASQVDAEIYALNATPAELGMPAMRYLGDQSFMNFIVYGGTVGVAVDTPGETAIIRAIELRGPTARFFMSAGVTWTNFHQYQGLESILNAAADAGIVHIDSGTVKLEGVWKISALRINGGTVIDNHGKVTESIDIVDLNGGVLDASDPINETRIYNVVNFEGGKLKGGNTPPTINTLNFPNANFQNWEVDVVSNT